MRDFRSKTGAACVLWLVLQMLLASAGLAQAPAATPWKAPDPLELKDQEIGLLKRQLGQTRQQIDKERVGRIVFETQLRVAALHGFAVKDVVSYAPLTREIVDRLVTESIRTEYPGQTLEHFVWFNQLFAALPQPFDMKGTVRDLMGEQAAGIYDPHSKQLFVKTDFPLESPLGQMVLAHEICHAFQDQNFSLIELGAEDAENSDRAMAALSIAEGDATLLMSEYFAKHGNPLDIFRFLPSMLSMDQEKLNNAPVSIQATLLFPYLDGMKFFQGVRGRVRPGTASTGQFPTPNWRNAIFTDPPTTTQQILHPELYLSRKLPAMVAKPKLPGAGKPTINVAGEFGLRLLLAPMLGNDRAAQAAAGWNGDRMAVADSADGQRRLMHWVTRWDSPQAAGEFAAALREALKARFAGKPEWKTDSAAGMAATEAATATGRLRVTGPRPDEVDLQVDLAKAETFPKVPVKAKGPSLLGLGF